MIMIRNKGLQGLALALILTMLFSVSVLAGEDQYSYSEGNWYEVYYSNVSIYEEDVTINGETVVVRSESYTSNSSGSYRKFSISGNNKHWLTYLIYITCDEWGWDYDILYMGETWEE